MNANRNITLVLLLITALVLGALVAATHWPRTAYADTPDRRGNYIMVAGQWSRSTDLIYVINIATRKLNVYFANRSTNNFELIDSVDLQKVFGKRAKP